MVGIRGMDMVTTTNIRSHSHDHSMDTSASTTSPVVLAEHMREQEAEGLPSPLVLRLVNLRTLCVVRM